MLSRRWVKAIGHPEVSGVTEMPDWFCIFAVDPAQFASFGRVLRLPLQRAAQVDLLCVFSMLKIPHELDGKCCAWMFECICLAPAWIEKDLPELELAGSDVAP